MADAMKRRLLQVIGLGAIAGCASAQPKGRSVSTVKFNYTDRYIGDVLVNGAWTGGVDAFGGGGKMAEGLIAPSDPNARAMLRVTWYVSGRLDFQTNRYVELPVEQKAAEVDVAWPYPISPSYLILHFYPDGRVEAELEADRPKRRIPVPPGYPR